MPVHVSTRHWRRVRRRYPLSKAATGAQTITPNAIATAESVPNPTVTTGAVTVSPNAIATSESVPNPQVNLTVFPGTVATGEVVRSPTLTTGGVTVTPNAIATGESVFNPTVTGGGATVVPDAIASGEVVRNPVVAGPVIAGTIASGEVVFEPTMTGGAPPAGKRMTRRWYAAYLKAEGVETPRHRVRLASYGSGVVTPGTVPIDVDETNEGEEIAHRVAANLTRFAPGASIPKGYRVVSESSGENITGESIP